MCVGVEDGTVLIIEIESGLLINNISLIYAIDIKNPHMDCDYVCVICDYGNGMCRRYHPFHQIPFSKNLFNQLEAIL